MRERLKTKPSEEIIENIFGPSIQSDINNYFVSMIVASKAHLIMLVNENIINEEKGKVILEVLNEMEERGGGVLEINPELEDLYFNIENYIVEKLGVEIGGSLHTGRSRNDLNATVFRMNTREKVLEILNDLNELRSSLINLADENLDVVISGYTHMQPAEPITFAHYISGILFSLERDFSRLRHAYTNLNFSPLGAAAMASTSFPINRIVTAELLGFDNITFNSLDSVASRDFVLEILSALNTTLITLSRISHDFYIWTTEEFSLIELEDSIAAVSSIMPQKKNPIILEHIKAKSAHIQGAYVSASSSLKNTPFGHTRDSSVESIKFFGDALEEAKKALILMRATVKSIKVDSDLAYKRSASNFSTVTELANMLVREEGLSFRMAHSVVAKFVNQKINSSEVTNDNDQEILQYAYKSVVGEDSNLSKSLIELALEPLQNVSKKKTLGGPAPSEVKLQLERLKNNLAGDRKLYLNKKKQVKNSKDILDEKVSRFIQSANKV